MEETDPNFFSGIFSPQPWELRSTASQGTVPHFHEGQTPRVPTAIVSQSSTPVESPIATPGRTRYRRRNVATRPKLRLLRLEEWDKERTYNEDPPTCLNYTIEWSATLNEKEFVRDTESDLVLNPSAYWQLSLQRRVERLVQKKLGDNTHKADHIVVVVSLSGRSEPKLVKHFEADIDWQCVEKHLSQWSDQFQSGKKLRVDITFHYVESVQQPIGSSSKRGNQRGTKMGASSATRRMSNRLHNQLSAEQESTGDAALWPHVYSVMRCPDACPRGPHCLIDPITKKHSKMFPHHLEDLILHKDISIEKFQSQADVPDDFRRQIFAEERQRRETDLGKSIKSSVGTAPITINNHFPDYALCSPAPASSGESIGPPRKSSVRGTDPLEIPSPLDEAVRDYSEWQKSRVSNPSWKADIDNARDVVLDQRRDLRQIHTDQDVSFLVQKDVRIGTAKRFVNDITTWTKRRRCDV